MIDTAATLDDMVLGALRGDVALLALLRPDPVAAAAAVVFGAGLLVRPSDPPFVLVRYEGAGTYALECHVLLGASRQRLAQLVGTANRIFDHVTWETPSTTRERPVWTSDVLPASGYLVDDGYKTLKRIVRFRVTLRQE